MNKNTVAFDKASARSYDANGHLIVDSTVITKAAVNPYYGKEIPNYESLGLDPEKIYNMLRDPVELEKGMHTLGEKQLLIKHIFVSADEPQKESIAGTIGSNLEMVGDDVKGSLTVWDKEAINLIESGKLAELSASYFYDPVMKSGTFNGQPYDGITTSDPVAVSYSVPTAGLNIWAACAVNHTAAAISLSTGTIKVNRL